MPIAQVTNNGLQWMCLFILLLRRRRLSLALIGALVDLVGDRR